jgi:hypothetical protein
VNSYFASSALQQGKNDALCELLLGLLERPFHFFLAD